MSLWEAPSLRAGDFGVPVPRVDGVGVGVDEPGGDERAARVVDLGVGDVVNHSGNALGQAGGWANPGNDPIAHDDGGVADQFDAGP